MFMARERTERVGGSEHFTTAIVALVSARTAAVATGMVMASAKQVRSTRIAWDAYFVICNTVC